MKIPATFIIADCTGKYNGIVYYTGARFAPDKKRAHIYKTEEGLNAALVGALKVMRQIDLWPGYNLSGCESVEADVLATRRAAFMTRDERKKRTSPVWRKVKAFGRRLILPGWG